MFTVSCDDYVIYILYERSFSFCTGAVQNENASLSNLIRDSQTKRYEIYVSEEDFV